MSSGVPQENLVGLTVAGKYEIVRKLGEGGMGTVYQAKQTAMERMVALKVIRPELVLTPEAAGRFQQEMRVTARIEHPNTVRLYDVGESDGRLYLAMELLAGTPLGDVIATGLLDLPRIVHIGKQIANALGAIHAHGVIHRDLKPDNVILLEAYGNRDFVKVLDFGVAKPLDQAGVNLTATGSIVGTPAYMPPEQALARPTDARADIYSLGIMLYQMVCGKVPFSEATTLTSMLIAHATEAPPPLLNVAPGISPALAALIMQMIEKDPARRPQTAGEVISRLDACVAGPGIPTTPPPAKKSSRLGLWLALAALLAGGGVAAALLIPGGTTTPATVADAAPVTAVPVTTTKASPDAATAVVAASPDAATAAAAVAVDAAPAALAATTPDAAVAPPPASRGELDAILARAGEPLAPAACRATDPATVKTLETAARAIFAGDAFKALAALADAPPTSVEALVLRARAELPDDAKKALATAEEAARLCPEYAVAHNLAGNALQKLGRIDDAEEAYGRALGEVPAYEAPRFNLGLSQLRRKDKGAVWTFTELVKRRPDYPNVYLARARAYVQLDKKDEALADLEEATRRQPQSAEAWNALGQLREHMKKPDAVAAFCEAKKLGDPAAARKCVE